MNAFRYRISRGAAFGFAADGIELDELVKQILDRGFELNEIAIEPVPLQAAEKQV